MLLGGSELSDTKLCAQCFQMWRCHCQPQRSQRSQRSQRDQARAVCDPHLGVLGVLYGPPVVHLDVLLALADLRAAPMGSGAKDCLWGRASLVFVDRFENQGRGVTARSRAPFTRECEETAWGSRIAKVRPIDARPKFHTSQFNLAPAHGQNGCLRLLRGPGVLRPWFVHSLCHDDAQEVES
jgi:hypothetical protein